MMYMGAFTDSRLHFGLLMLIDLFFFSLLSLDFCRDYSGHFSIRPMILKKKAIGLQRSLKLMGLQDITRCSDVADRPRDALYP